MVLTHLKDVKLKDFKFKTNNKILVRKSSVLYKLIKSLIKGVQFITGKQKLLRIYFVIVRR